MKLNRPLCGATYVLCLALASHAVAQTPSLGWASADIGTVLPGSTQPASNGFAVRAAGADVWNLSDEFRFVYRPLTGVGVIITRVENMNAADAWSKAGLMFRESLSPDSKHGFVVLSGTQGASFQRRAVTGDWTAEMGRLWCGGTTWLKLERQGSTLTAFCSNDG